MIHCKNWLPLIHYTISECMAGNREPNIVGTGVVIVALRHWNNMYHANGKDIPSL